MRWREAAAWWTKFRLLPFGHEVPVAELPADGGALCGVAVGFASWIVGFEGDSRLTLRSVDEYAFAQARYRVFPKGLVLEQLP